MVYYCTRYHTTSIFRIIWVSDLRKVILISNNILRILSKYQISYPGVDIHGRNVINNILIGVKCKLFLLLLSLSLQGIISKHPSFRVVVALPRVLGGSCA